MKILITGANGLLGQKLVKLYESDDQVSVIATGKGSNRNLPGSYHYEQLDVTSSEEVAKVISQHRPDVVINTATMTHVDQCELDPVTCENLIVDAVINLIEAC